MNVDKLFWQPLVGFLIANTSYCFSHLLLIFYRSLSYIANSIPGSLIQTVAGFPSGPKPILCSVLSVLLVKLTNNGNCKTPCEFAPWLYGDVSNTACSRQAGTWWALSLCSISPTLLQAGYKLHGYLDHCQYDASEIAWTSASSNLVLCFSSLQNTSFLNPLNSKMGSSIVCTYFF